MDLGKTIKGRLQVQHEAVIVSVIRTWEVPRWHGPGPEFSSRPFPEHDVSRYIVYISRIKCYPTCIQLFVMTAHTVLIEEHALR